MRRSRTLEADMAFRPGTLRGCIGLRWEMSGRPSWDLARTISVAKECDTKLEAEGRNPAPKFRRKKGDRKYVEAYIRFFQFEWL
jgi:hypothetical protein